jgi:hypothetical protein
MEYRNYWVSFLIAITNQLLHVIFKQVIKFEKRINIDDETQSLFTKVMYTQFMNMSLLILLYRFKFYDGIPIGVKVLNGDITGFNINFYK